MYVSKGRSESSSLHLLHLRHIAARIYFEAVFEDLVLLILLISVYSADDIDVSALELQ